MQRTASCTKVGHTRSGAPVFFCVSQSTQTIYESPTARSVHVTSRALFGGVRNTSNSLFGGVRNTSNSVYSSDSPLLLSRPSVSGAYLVHKKKNYLGISSVIILFPVRSNCYFFLYRYQLYCFQYVLVAAHVFSFFDLSCTVSKATSYAVRKCYQKTAFLISDQKSASYAIRKGLF